MFEVGAGKEAMRTYRTTLESQSAGFDLRYLLAILNSAFGKSYLISVRRSQVGFYPDDLKQLPIKRISLPAQQAFIDKVTALNAPQITINAKNELIEKLNNMVDALYAVDE